MTQIADSAPHRWGEMMLCVFGHWRVGIHCLDCHLRARCSHGCGFLQWAEDQWYCPKCENEFNDDMFGPCPKAAQIDSSGARS